MVTENASKTGDTPCGIRVKEAIDKPPPCCTNVQMPSPAARPRQLVVKARPAPDGEDNATLVRLIKRQLLEQLCADFDPNLRLPPIRQIADEFGVSVGTANQAVKDLCDAGVLVSRPRRGTVIAPGCTAEHLREISHLDACGVAARGPLAGKVIQVVLNNEGDQMIVEMAESCARAVTDLGCRVAFTDFGKYRDQVKQDATQGDAAVLFQPPRRNNVLHLIAPQPTLVVATSPMVVDSLGGYDMLSVDDEQGGFIAGRHVRDAGYPSACFIGRRYDKQTSGRYDTISARRCNGFERGFGEPIPDAYRLYVGASDIDFGAQVVVDFVKLDPLPEAVFCSSDDVAIGFVFGAMAHGLKPARDYQLIGFDKQQRAIELPAGPITTVEVPRDALGRRGAELIASRLADPSQPVRNVLLGCRLFEGKTFTYPRQEASS